ncbi:MAG: hypothetical protein OK452_08020 [Thaumarchaeota archaeon]|nr:hypothetical protein [Nitrososphaerota archaeon]
MEGKRFAAGLVGGLLLGLVIVTAASGFTFGLYGSFTSVSSNEGGLLSSTTGAKSATTTNSLPVSPPSQTSPNSTFNTVGGSTTTTTTSPTPSADLGSAVNTPILSSHVGNIAQQPILANAIIFLPVLVAFLLGAVLYRASTKRRGEASDEAI